MSQAAHTPVEKAVKEAIAEFGLVRFAQALLDDGTPWPTKISDEDTVTRIQACCAKARSGTTPQSRER